MNIRAASQVGFLFRVGNAGVLFLVCITVAPSQELGFLRTVRYKNAGLCGREEETVLKPNRAVNTLAGLVS